MAKIKLKTIVGYFLDEINGGKAEFARAYRMAVLINRQMKWDLTGKIVTTCIEINDDLTATIPDSSLKVKKVSVRDVSTGKLVGLTENKSLGFFCDSSKDLDFEDRENVFDFDNDEDSFDNYISESLGKGGYRNIGEYRISEEQGIIILSPDFCHSSIYIEHISSEDDDGEVCVNELLTEAILAGVRHKWHFAKKGTSGFDKQLYHSHFIQEKKNARYRMKKPKIQDMNRVARQSVKFLKS